MSADRLEAAEECDVCSERLNVDFTCPNVGDPTHDRLEDELWDERVGPDAMIDSEAELAELAAEARTTAAYLRWHLAGTTARHLIELADGIDRLLAERKELVAWWRYSSSPIDSAIVFQALHGGAYTGLPAPRWLVDASEKP
jgi:hypothetical protein